MSEKDLLARLHDLSKALVENEADRHRSCQASPVYYVVVDRRKETRPDGYGDETMYLDDGAEISESDYGTLSSLGHDEDLSELAFEWEEFTVEDRMFMTRAEADSWIGHNRHHVSEWAHSCAMTALESPTYAKLVSLLIAFGAEPEDGDAS